MKNHTKPREHRPHGKVSAKVSTNKKGRLRGGRTLL
jgi:hypothetical protein